MNIQAISMASDDWNAGYAEGFAAGIVHERNRIVKERRQEIIVQNKCHREAAERILEFLNLKTGRNYQPVSVNLDMIRARLREGATEAQCRGVIARKVAAWGKDESMEKYLRPATLFNRTKFAQYQGELPRTAFGEGAPR